MYVCIQLYEKERKLQERKDDNDIKIQIARDMNEAALWLPQYDLRNTIHSLLTTDYPSLPEYVLPVYTFLLFTFFFPTFSFSFSFATFFVFFSVVTFLNFFAYSGGRRES